jgi:hypothetical protein
MAEGETTTPRKWSNGSSAGDARTLEIHLRLSRVPKGVHIRREEDV